MLRIYRNLLRCVGCAYICKLFGGRDGIGGKAILRNDDEGECTTLSATYLGR
jgi:hypothetical protein